ncbi:hypothetical protein D5086_029517 [Populus alba]|uniref:Uncharacterized protein n=1 Tax=Populus alba TaxID=43335 RepID=A0ACC4ATT0_POPAL
MGSRRTPSTAWLYFLHFSNSTIGLIWLRTKQWPFIAGTIALENGNLKGSSKEIRHGRTAHNMSSSFMRQELQLRTALLYQKFDVGMLRNLLTNLQRELIIAIFALWQHKITSGEIFTSWVPYYQTSSWFLAPSLFCGGIANLLERNKKYDRLENAAEHAGAVIFAFKNKLDISLGVALGSATQIAMFHFCVIVAWILGIEMDLNFNLPRDWGALTLSIITTAFTLQDGTSHYLKGLALLLCYVVIGACFFLNKTPLNHGNVIDLGVKSAAGSVIAA